MSVTAESLRAEFEGWISAHPNASLFDWEVAARNVNAPTNHPRFVVELELKGDAFRTGDDVARALTRLAAGIAGPHPADSSWFSPKVMDVNGNTVGTWRIEKP